MLPPIAQDPPPPPLPEMPVDANLIAWRVVPLLGGALALLFAVMALRRSSHHPLAKHSRSGSGAARAASLARPATTAVPPSGWSGWSRTLPIQREVAGLAERLDFAERKLADRRQPQLRAGEPSGHHG